MPHKCNSSNVGTEQGVARDLRPPWTVLSHCQSSTSESTVLVFKYSVSTETTLVLFSRYGIYERCRELVEAGYDVRQPDKENVTLLHWAAINNRIDLVKYVFWAAH